MCMRMQSFLYPREELAATPTIPDEVVAALSEAGWPKIRSSHKESRVGGPGEVFSVQFEKEASESLAPTGPGGDRTRAVLQVLTEELSASPIFSPDALVSVAQVRQVLVCAGKAGVDVPRLWASGEICRRNLLRRLPWVLLERLDTPASTGVPAGTVSGLPRFDDPLVLIAELRRLAVASGATEIDSPLAKLATSCRDELQLTPAPPTLMFHHETASADGAGGGSGDTSGSDAGGAGGGGDGAPGGLGSLTPWPGAAICDPRMLSASGAPWEILRAFCHVVKARWLMDVLRRTPVPPRSTLEQRVPSVGCCCPRLVSCRAVGLVAPLTVPRRWRAATQGSAPRCQLSLLLEAHDRAQLYLAENDWLPKYLVNPGSSSAKLAQTFPEEMCGHY